ncbi:MAG: toprim domain-containing protein [Iamia sp.]
MTGPEAEEAMAGHLAHRGWHPVAVDVFGLTVVRSRSGLAIRHPYRNDGRVVWWQDRSLGGDGPKWLAPSGSGRRIPHAVDLRRSLEAAPTSDGWPVIIVFEAPANGVSLWHVAPGACVVGLPGTSRPQRWAPLLAGALVLIATDADDAGDKAAAELAPAVHAHGGRSLRLRPPEGLDVTDWRQRIGDDAAFLVAIEDAADRPWWSAAEGVAA